MNFELVDLRAFIAVSDLGSFHRAAKALNLSQPALSRRIQKLEESLGAPLLERSTRHVALTMVGRDFIPKVRRFLDEFETSVLSIRDLGARSGGLVSIASVPTAVFYFLPRAISRFSAAYPRIRIRILDVSANEGLGSRGAGRGRFRHQLHRRVPSRHRLHAPDRRPASSWPAVTIIRWRHASR